MEVSLKRATLGEQVTQLLRERILNGEFEGERLVESELADQLSVSRTPVREALKTLEASGLVRRQDNGHLVPTDRSLADMIEAFHFRMALESYAAGMTAKTISERQLSALEEKCEAFEALEDADNFDGNSLMQLGQDFHDLIVTFSDNQHIIRHVRDINEYTSIYRQRLFRAPRRLEGNLVSHRDILEAIRARDSERARHLMETHLTYALNLLTELWQKA